MDGLESDRLAEGLELSDEATDVGFGRVKRVLIWTKGW